MTKTETTKDGSSLTLADFKAAGKQVASGVTGYKDKMQTFTLYAFQHVEKHGDYNVLKPLFQAASTFSKGEGRRWRDYVVTYTWLTYNPRKLSGAKLASADYGELWAKDKAKAMRVTEAEAVKWYDHEMNRGDTKTKKVSTEAFIAKVMKQVQAAIFAHTLLKGEALATVADVRAELKAQLEALTAEPDTKVTESTKVTKLPAKARKRTARKAVANVNKPATIKAAA